MLVIHNLACIRDNRRLFSGLNDEIGPGDWVQIAGVNGVGNTSLLALLNKSELVTTSPLADRMLRDSDAVRHS